ncbi:MAG TPA: hypothetical protein VEA38_24830 [Terriglobales bacterium]|nr:hypothetical protein [Terriglobales bacterium]
MSDAAKKQTLKVADDELPGLERVAGQVSAMAGELARQGRRLDVLEKDAKVQAKLLAERGVVIEKIREYARQANETATATRGETREAFEAMKKHHEQQGKAVGRLTEEFRTFSASQKSVERETAKQTDMLESIAAKTAHPLARNLVALVGGAIGAAIAAYLAAGAGSPPKAMPEPAAQHVPHAAPAAAAEVGRLPEESQRHDAGGQR